jgi:hypothetical protein
MLTMDLSGTTISLAAALLAGWPLARLRAQRAPLRQSPASRPVR